MYKELVDEIIKYSSPFTYLDAVIFNLTSNVSSVVVEHYSRYSGSTIYNFFISLSLFFKMLTSSSTFLLRVTAIFGSVFTLIGFFLGFYFIYLKFNKFIDIPGWASCAVLILFIGGFQLIFLGLMGEYLGKIYLSINNMKIQYSEREVFGFDPDTRK